MEIKELVSKTALDKESLELGKIIRIDRLPHKLTKKAIPHLILQYKIRFRKNVSVPIEYSKVTKVKGNQVWLDITKDEYLEEVERQKKILFEREQFKNFVNVQSKWFESNVADLRPRQRRE